MSSTGFSRSRGLAPAFTLIELLVVVAIIALLISILLPSLSKAREQAKAAVCAANNHNVGQSCMIYMGQFAGKFPLCDPYYLNPDGLPGTSWDPRSGQLPTQKFDPVHGYIALYANEIPPDIPSQNNEPWEEWPWGFRVQSQYEPDTLWEGFFCPSQNRRNTIEDNSPERDLADDHDQAAEAYKYATGYMPNRLLRGGSPRGTIGPSKPSANALPANMSKWDNAFTTPYVHLDHPDLGSSVFYLQANTLDKVVAPADCVYMCDSMDYMARGTELVDDRFGGVNEELGAGSWFELTQGPPAVVLGARHLGRSMVLYADGHSDRENQVPRNKRGDLVTATTFADFIEEDGVGTQHHVMPCWRKYK